MSTWLIESCLGSAFLKGGGTHRLQKEWRHGKSLGSLLLKLNLQIGHVSISSNVLCCFVLSSSAGKLSASFSTIITKSSASVLAFTSILWSGTCNPFHSIDTTLRMGTGNPVCFSTYMEHKYLQLLKNRHLSRGDLIRRVIVSDEEANVATLLILWYIRQIINYLPGLRRFLFKPTI